MFKIESRRMLQGSSRLQFAGAGRLLLLLPILLFLCCTYAAPLVSLIVSSTRSRGGDSIGLDAYRRFFSDPVYVDVLWSSVSLGLWCTAICAVLSFPVAYVYVRASARMQVLLSFLIALPLLTSIVVRTFAWVVILGKDGILNYALQIMGVVEQPLRLLFTHVGVVIALSQIMLPFMVLPLISSMSRLDGRLHEASTSLGAGPWRTLLKVTLPLNLPGFVAGSLMVFSISISAFVTPSIIGAGKVLYMPNIIYQQAVLLLDWPFASAVSTVLLAIVLAAVTLLSVLGRTRTVAR